MKIIKAKDYNDMSRKAANIISAQVIMKPDCVLGLATGSTPVGTYKQLIEWYEKGDLDFGDVTTVNLDEYKGLPRENDQSYFYFMNHNLFDYVNINPERTHLPNGMNLNAEEECARYEEVIILQAVSICSFLVWDTTDISDSTSREKHLRRRPIVSICRRGPLRQIRDFSHPSTRFRSRHIPWVSRPL